MRGRVRHLCVSRIREDVTVENGLSIWVVSRQSAQGRRAQHRADPRNADRAQSGASRRRLGAPSIAVSRQAIGAAPRHPRICSGPRRRHRLGRQLRRHPLGRRRGAAAAADGAALSRCAAVPAVFFIRRPKVELGILIAYGFAIGVLQFGLLFAAIKLGMPAGLSSLVMQLQAFFTIGLAVAVPRRAAGPVPARWAPPSPSPGSASSGSSGSKARRWCRC